MIFSTHDINALIELCVISLSLNIPLGAWRVSVRKLSWQWFVAVHLSVPIIFILRHQLGLGLQYIPVSIACALSGHFIGGKIGIRVLRTVKRGLALIIESIK